MKIFFLLLFLAIITSGIFAQNDTIKREFHIGLAYPLSTNGMEAPRIINKFSLQAIMGISAGIDGLELAGIASVVNGDVKGIQASGCLNTSAGKAQGVQATGCVNMVSGDFQGLQSSGVINMARNVNGIQATGMANMAIGKMQGIQFSGFINMADSLRGIQGAGFMNLAQQTKGVQFSGFINIAGNIEGIQGAGFINIAQNVDGVQMSGFINIADSSDCPIGIINLIKKGKKTFNLQTNQFNDVNLSFKSGGRKMFGIIGIGYNPFFTEFAYSFHAGIGYTATITNRLTTNIEIISMNYFSQRELENEIYHFGACAGINLLLDYRFFNHFGITVGPSINYIYTENEARYNQTPYSIYNSNIIPGFQKIFLGFTAGVYYRL